MVLFRVCVYQGYEDAHPMLDVTVFAWNAEQAVTLVCQPRHIQEAGWVLVEMLEGTFDAIEFWDVSLSASGEFFYYLSLPV